MSNIVVDATDASVSAPEAITNDAVVEKAVETTPDMPAKFAGKSAEDMAKIYVNLEKELGRKNDEVGELRKLSDSFLQAEVSRNQKGPAHNPQPTVEEQSDDFYDDPAKAVNSMIDKHPKFQQFQKFQQQQGQIAAATKLKEKYPDFADKVGSDDFRKYVEASPIRMSLYKAADAGYNLDAASELIDGFDSQSVVAKTRQVKAAQESSRKSALMKGTTETSASVDVVGGKDFYRRAELIRLRIEDPAKYEAHQDEIFKAYAEGRVK